MTRACPNCGQSIKVTAKFCKYCGERLTPPTPRAPVVPQLISSRAPVAKPVTEVPADVLRQLDTRSALKEIDEEEKKLVEELERLEKELEEDDRSIAELEKEIKPLQKKIKALKEREKKLKAKVKPFAFEKAGKERERWTERLDKLEELKESGKTRESVYTRLHEEYEASRAKADAEYRQQVLLSREWLALLKGQFTATRDELSLLDARYSVGEVKELDYKSRKSKLEKRTKILGHHVEVLEGILRDF